jgi:hypothetical protein
VDQRLEDLAVDDLIAASIHVRRLLELTAQKSMASKVMVSAFVRGEPQDLPLTRLINGVIHHTSMKVIRRRSDTLPAPTKDNPESFVQFYQAVYVGLHPVIWLSSDLVDHLAFRVDFFAAGIAKEILGPIVEYCDDNELYLEDMNLE